METPIKPVLEPWVPWFSSAVTPPSPRRRARAALARLASAVHHPGAKARAAFAAVVPLPLRRSLLATLAPQRAKSGCLGRSWQAALAELPSLPPPRRLALIVGAETNPPPPWLAGLAAAGWQPVFAADACQTAATVAPRPYPCVAPPGSPGDSRHLTHRLATVASSPHPSGVVLAASPAAWPLARTCAQTLRWPAMPAWSGTADLVPRVTRLFPPMAVVVVTYRHPDLTLLCLESLRRCTIWPALDIVIVDNASPDGTAEICQEVASRDRRVQVLANSANRGFPRAVNQGVAASNAELICILNNDVVVTPGWCEALTGALLNHRELGAAGPSTNAAGNEARVRATYKNLAELDAVAWRHARSGARYLEVAQLGFFCVAVRRSLWQEVGGLDEGFGLGYFEDAAFCRRARRLGWRLRCLRHCFVHHEQGAAFRTLPEVQLGALYERNRRRYRQLDDPDS